MVNNIMPMRILLYKPSKFFWTFAILAFITWLVLGPISWRHVDDYGPIEDIILGKVSLIKQLKYLFYWYWGTYPPIWHIWAFFSYIFVNISMDLSRFILLVQGFLTTLISAYLTFCICKSIILEVFILSKTRKLVNSFFIVEILSITFNSLNPEIMVHASSYMPYNLPALTTQTTILIIFSILKNEKVYKQKNKGYIFLNFKTGLLIFLFSLLLGYQSIILLISLSLMVLLIYLFSLRNNGFYPLKRKNVNFQILFLNLRKIFRKSNCFDKLIFTLILFLFLAYIRKFFIAFYLNDTYLEIQPWSGLDNVFNIPSLKNGLKPFFDKSIFSLISVLGQSIYPFRYNQYFAASVIFVFIFIGYFLTASLKNYGILFAIYMFSVFITTFITSLFTRFWFSPTRHTIFLYPFAWVCIIIFVFNIYLKNELLSKKLREYLASFLTITIFIFNLLGTIDSHSLIQYSNEEIDILNTYAETSDYHINGGYAPYSGVFQSHGSKEFNALKNKDCSIDKLESKEFTVFMYNHRIPFDSNNPNQRLEIYKNSNGCIPLTADIKIIEKIERVNKLDIEQNNLIYNGGSSLYGYIINVVRN